MINKQNLCLNKLITPKLIQYNENEKKNESPPSDKKISIKPIIRPEPLNINLINGINGKSMNKKGEVLYQTMNFYGTQYSPRIFMHDNYISK